MINATNVGKYFIKKNYELTDIQVQKLVYYSYVWYMVTENKRKLFEERPQAWIHGPVFRSLFDSMKNSSEFRIINDEELKDLPKGLLDFIFNLYGKYSGNELEFQTHSEKPWQEARHGLPSNVRSERELNDDTIYDFYTEQLSM